MTDDLMADQLTKRYEISHDAARLDVALVHHWLSTDAYWALSRTRETVESAIAASLNFGAYDRDGTQVAVARVVTDLATFAWLCDVYVDRSHRGNGVGTQLVTAIHDHLAPYRIRRFLLATADAHAVYAKVGFEPLPNPERFMSMSLDR